MLITMQKKEIKKLKIERRGSKLWDKILNKDHQQNNQDQYKQQKIIKTNIND